MKAPSRPGCRLRIDRLELDVRGIAPATSEAAARVLGSALARALDSHAGLIAPIERVEAGRIESPVSPAAPDLAARIAAHIARTLRRSRP